MAEVDLPAALSRTATLVEAALEALLPQPEGAEARLADAMRYATLGGGKRLRAFLVMESAALFAVSETCAARVAASIEMLHAYSLVHDDLPAMDDDDLRRGRPSTHKAFDEATAILAGDALQQLQRSPRPPLAVRFGGDDPARETTRNHLIRP
jgi:farnesyl diphosphate synthase